MKVQIQIRGWGKNDMFFIDRKEEKKKGRREKRAEGEEGGEKKEGKKGGKERNVNVFRLKKQLVLYPHSTNLDQGLGKK